MGGGGRMCVAGLGERERGWNGEARQILIVFSFELDDRCLWNNSSVGWKHSEKERRELVALRVVKLVRPGLRRSSREDVE